MYEVDDGIGDIQGQITDKQVLYVLLFSLSQELGGFRSLYSSFR